MKWISLFENFNQGTRKFYHLTSKDQLPSLFKGIRKDMAGKWEQGAGFYVTTDLVYTESIEGVGSRIGEAIVEIEAPLNSANFDLDFEMNSNLENAINKFLPQIKKRFVRTMKVDNFLILFNQKPNISFRRLKIRDAEVKVPESESRDWCYICIGSSGNLELEHNIEGAIVTRHMFQKFPSDIQEAIRTEIFDAESPGALRYIGPMIKPTRYKIKEAGSWSDWKDISEFYLESIQHGYGSKRKNIRNHQIFHINDSAHHRTKVNRRK